MTPTCPKCSAEMQPGALLETRPDNRLAGLVWMEARVLSLAGAPVRPDLEGHATEARRCTACGFVELWATEKRRVAGLPVEQ